MSHFLKESDNSHRISSFLNISFLFPLPVVSFLDLSSSSLILSFIWSALFPMLSLIHSLSHLLSYSAPKFVWFFFFKVGGSEVKASACNAGDLGLIPGLGRSPGEGNGNALQYSCLENPMDTGAWWAIVHGVAKSRTRLSDFTFTLFMVKYSFCSLILLVSSLNCLSFLLAHRVSS